MRRARGRVGAFPFTLDWRTISGELGKSGGAAALRMASVRPLRDAA